MIVHAVHTTNLAAYYDPSTGRDLRRRSKASLILEMKKARKMGISTLVFQ
jgi:endonuclease IV